MKLTTWNVNGIRAREEQVAEWLRVEQPDVLCLQEIKASPHQVPTALLELDGYWAHWHGEGGYSGVALLVRKTLSPTRPSFIPPPFDAECRVTVAALDDVDLATLYVPNGGKDFDAKIRFLEALRDWVAVRQAAGRKLLLCGDFNVALTEHDVHEKLRNPKETGQTEGERGLMAKVLAQGLTDLGRRFAPDDTELFTWWAPWRQYRDRNIGWRLDLVLASAPLSERATGCVATRVFGTSDHGPVTATFDGPLFDPLKVVGGDAPPKIEKPAPPQLDLFS